MPRRLSKWLFPASLVPPRLSKWFFPASLVPSQAVRLILSCLPGASLVPPRLSYSPWCLPGASLVPRRLSNGSFPASLVPRKLSNESFPASLVPLRLPKWSFPASLVPPRLSQWFFPASLVPPWCPPAVQMVLSCLPCVSWCLAGDCLSKASCSTAAALSGRLWRLESPPPKTPCARAVALWPSGPLLKALVAQHLLLRALVAQNPPFARGGAWQAHRQKPPALGPLLCGLRVLFSRPSWRSIFFSGPSWRRTRLLLGEAPGKPTAKNLLRSGRCSVAFGSSSPGPRNTASS